MYSVMEGIDLHLYEQNSNWDIISASWKEDFTLAEPSISFESKIRRKPLYVILVVLLPISLLAILNLCVFVLPCDSGKKASYAITVFLAFAVFLSLISSTLPKNSNNVAIVFVFVIVQTISSTLITVAAMAMIRLSSKPDSYPVPVILTYISLIIRCRCCCKRCCRSPEVAVTDSTTKVTMDTVCECKEDSHKMTWKEDVDILDKKLFVFFLLVFIFPRVFHSLLRQLYNSTGRTGRSIESEKTPLMSID